MPYGHVYLVTNKANGKVYVGQTTASIAKRWRDHVSSAVRGCTRGILYPAIRKYGRYGFTVQAIAAANDKKSLGAAEHFFITMYEARDKEKGYNLREGGVHGKFSLQSRQKLAAVKTGKPLKPEHRNNIARAMSGSGNGFYGKKHTEEFKTKMRNRVVSKETRLKQSLQRRKEDGVRFRHDISTKLLVWLYTQGLSTYRVAKLVKFDAASVWRRLKAEGVLRVE